MMKKDGSFYGCGAVLLSCQTVTVLTAAHCVDGWVVNLLNDLPGHDFFDPLQPELTFFVKTLMLMSGRQQRTSWLGLVTTTWRPDPRPWTPTK